MNKDFKITVKPFLNKYLSLKESGYEDKFPLYYQVTYKRKNTQIKSIFNIYLLILSDISKKEQQIIDFELKNIENTISYLAKIQDKNIPFSLQGIKSKYQTFMQDIYVVFENYLKKRLLKVVKYTNTEYLSILKFDGFDVDFLLLLKAVKILNENFNKNIPLDFKEEIDTFQKIIKIIIKKDSDDLNYLSLLKWKTENAKVELKNKMIIYFGEEASKSEKTILILDAIIDETLKF